MDVSSRWLFACLGWLLVCGCNSTSKNEHAVFGPTPQRTSLEDAPNARAIAEAEDLTYEATVSGTDEGSGRVVTADIERPKPGNDEQPKPAGNERDIFYSTVVARANGSPIFAGEVLERYGDYLRQVRPKVNDADFQKIREEIIRRDLRGHIEKHLLVERTKGELKPDQLKALQAQLDKVFEKEVEKLKKELNVSTRTELERELINRGTSLNDIRNSFVSQGMARGYIDARAEKPKPINRQNVVDYYQQHLDDYRFPAKVRWRQIQITHSGAGGKASAEKKLLQARAELDRGVAFEDVVVKYSDGPTASNKGQRDWVTEGSLSDEKLDKLLFSAKAGGEFVEHFGSDSCQIVQVEERTDAGKKPFEDVQVEILMKLQPTGPANIQELIDEILADAVIETKYEYGARTP